MEERIVTDNVKNERMCFGNQYNLTTLILKSLFHLFLKLFFYCRMIYFSEFTIFFILSSNLVKLYKAFFTVEGAPLLPNKECSDVCHSTAVSYTHLDVYKRQVLD